MIKKSIEITASDWKYLVRGCNYSQEYLRI